MIPGLKKKKISPPGINKVRKDEKMKVDDVFIIADGLEKFYKEKEYQDAYDKWHWENCLKPNFDPSKFDVYLKSLK